MSQEFTISSGPLPGSEKIYVKGEMFDIEVPMRRINLTPTVDTDGTKIENEPVVVYDTSGPYTDPNYTVDLHKGLPKIREQWHCREHLHLKCVQCGRIYHLDCHFMDEVRAHLMAEHGFTLQCEGSVLYGLCRRCAQQNEQAEQTAENSNSAVDTDKKP